MGESRPKYILDECIGITAPELMSGEYLESKEILSAGAPDELVLSKAKELHLILITGDKDLIKKAVFDKVPVIWQNPKNERRMIQGEFIGSEQTRICVCKKTRAMLLSDTVVVP